MNEKMNPNPIGLAGIEFVEFSSKDPERLRKLFWDFGFSKTAAHKTRAVELWTQNDIHFILNIEPGSFASKFNEAHGPCISSMAWRVVGDAKDAHDIAVSRGAKSGTTFSDFNSGGKPVDSIFGIGESLIYFLKKSDSGFDYRQLGFEPLAQPKIQPDKGFVFIDHLTNNVPQGTMKKWSDFYKEVFGFTEVRYFDIRGVKTGLTSYALRSPCGNFCIPINEGSEAKSQINEYLEEYKGPGVQHLAFASNNLLASLQKMEGTTIETLDIDDEYYADVFKRIPNVTEDHAEIKRRQVLVDGDDEGYLLQIFTRNLVGPIFIELIQRKNHLSFGEGNFGALFRSIERDQQRRGFL